MPARAATAARTVARAARRFGIACMGHLGTSLAADAAPRGASSPTASGHRATTPRSGARWPYRLAIRSWSAASGSWTRRRRRVARGDMASRAKPLAALAAPSVLTLAACSSTTAASPAAVTAPPPSPLESPAASPSPAAVAVCGRSCERVRVRRLHDRMCRNLTAGVHSSSNFTIPLQFTVSHGWVNVRDPRAPDGRLPRSDHGETSG